jgi:hypothetical protein
VVLGPRARTNFEYAPSAAPGGQSVLVAPIFTRSDTKQPNQTVRSTAIVSVAGLIVLLELKMTQGELVSEASAAPKRTYVGIKIKRQAINGMNAMMNDDKRVRLDQQVDDSAAHRATMPTSVSGHPSFPSTMGLPPFPRDYSASGRPAGSGGPMSNFPGGLQGSLVSPEEQLRWYEQFFQMQQQLQAGAPFFFNQAPAFPPVGANFGGFNPFLAGMQPGTGFMSPEGATPFGFTPDSSRFASGDSSMMQNTGGMPPLFPSMQGYFPTASASALGPGMYSMASHGGLHGAVDVVHMLLAAQQAGRSGEPGLAGQPATMSQAMDGVHSGVRSSTVSSARDRSAISAMGHLLTLSEAAASSQPNSSNSTPEVSLHGPNSSGQGRSVVSVHSDTHSSYGSDRERTSQLLAAASAVLRGSGEDDGVSPREAGSRTDGAGSRSVVEGAEEDDEPDWRDQLYYWTGNVVLCCWGGVDARSL